MSGDEWVDDYDDFRKVEDLESLEIELNEEDLDVQQELASELDDISLGSDVNESQNMRSDESIPRPTLRQEIFVLGAMIAVIILVVALFSIGYSLYATSDNNTSPETAEDLTIHKRTLILISLDGFRYEYFEDDSLRDVRTNLDALASRGAFSPMIPVFPSVTFPNHWTIVTGLWAESHGIVENEMYDPTTDQYYSIFNNSANDPSWYGGEALWETFQQNGGISGSVFWPGSYCEGRKPNYTLPYDGEMSYTDRVSQVMEWLSLSEEVRPRFISLYLNAVDSAGHEAGPTSNEVREAIRLVDQTVGSLIERVNDLSFSDTVNYMIVSDHGMVQVEPEQVIYLDDYIDLIEDAQVITWGPLCSIWGLHGRGAQLHYQLQEVEHTTVFFKEEMPWDFHYTYNERIPDILVLADEGWTISSHSRTYSVVGDHGYNPYFGSMNSFLIAQGDFFQSGYVSSDPISNIHLYSVMSRLLNIVPAPNNGSWVSLCPFLNDQC